MAPVARRRCLPAMALALLVLCGARPAGAAPKLAGPDAYAQHDYKYTLDQACPSTWHALMPPRGMLSCLHVARSHAST